MDVLDDARPNTAAAAAAVNHIATFGWEGLNYAPYSPNLAPSDFHFFPTFKMTFDGRHFTTNEDVEAAIRTQDTQLLPTGVLEAAGQMHQCRWDYVKK
jgi:hypothetical protein